MFTEDAIAPYLGNHNPSTHSTTDTKAIFFEHQHTCALVEVCER